MRGILLAAAMLCLALVGAAPVALAQGAGMSGVWIGYYGYDANPNEVEFQMKLRASGSGFSGTSVEDNTFGDPSVLFLTANIGGSIGANRAVNFTKTYDGTGGQSHSVRYSGLLSASGKCISGKWSIGQDSGPFAMCTDVRLVS